MRYQIFDYKPSDDIKKSICNLRDSITPWVNKQSNYAAKTHYDRANRMEMDSRGSVNTYFFVCKSCGAELYGFCNMLDIPYDIDRLVMCTKEVMRLNPCAETKKLNDRAIILQDNFNRERRKQSNEAAGWLQPCPICGEQLCKDAAAGLYTTYSSMVRYSSVGKAPRIAHHDDVGSFDGVFGWLTPFRKKGDLKPAEEAAEAYAEECNLIAPISSKNVSAISKDEEQLKKYILHLIQLENNIYSLKKQLTSLYCHRFNAERAVVLSEKEPIFKQKELLKQHKKEMEQLLKTQEEKVEALQHAYVKAQKDARIAEQRQPQVSVNYPKPPTKPVYGTPGLFNKKKVLAENEALKAKYEAALESYRQEVKRCDEKKEQLLEEKRAAILADVAACQARISEAKASLDEETEKTDALRARLESETDDVCKIEVAQNQFNPAYAAKELVDKEIAETESLLKRTFAARNELYAYDIVFGKYRDVVALSSFYEYLMSGRCSSLEGADGAYNIYEGEIRADRVIAQLDTVITSLEEIKQNQYMMYQELRNINVSLDKMNNTLDEALTSIQSMGSTMEHIAQNSDVIAQNSDVLAKNSKVIAHNTAVTAYYSKINAELTNALGYMVAFK